MSTIEDNRDVTAVRLSDDDIGSLMNLLRNATQPVTTQQLIDALRRQSVSSEGPAAGEE